MAPARGDIGMAGERILVVDDEAEIVELLTDVLVAEGYVVDAAPDPGVALQFVREHIYDVAILDFNLPDMDGVMLHHQIRQMDAELAARTIFMSGLLQSDENLGYYMSQSGGFLAKPFDIHEVLRQVRAVLGEES
jgi:two-component system response regulator QseB